MRKLTFTLAIMLISGIALFAQEEPETYTALKVTGDNVPVIDGTIDPVWSAVEIIPLTKVPENEQITVSDPDPSDYYAEFGMLWDDTGFFFYFKVVDDVLVIFDDDPTLDAQPADKWWYDDNVNILFSQDLVNETFNQWEFAYQPGINQEEKLSSDDWLNAAKFSSDLVESAWYQDGTTYILETWISLDCFSYPDFLAPGLEIQFEMRARDDDDAGVEGSSWETMFQWSTTRYDVEGDGVGMGVVTLSEDEAQAPNGLADKQGTLDRMNIYPNPSHGSAELHFKLEKPGDVSVSVYDISGKMVNELNFRDRAAGENTLALDLEDLQPGVYFLNASTAQKSKVAKFVKQ